MPDLRADLPASGAREQWAIRHDGRRADALMTDVASGRIDPGSV